jgi:hypothetical protein
LIDSASVSGGPSSGNDPKKRVRRLTAAANVTRRATSRGRRRASGSTMSSTELSRLQPISSVALARTTARASAMRPASCPGVASPMETKSRAVATIGSASRSARMLAGSRYATSTSVPAWPP